MQQTIFEAYQQRVDTYSQQLSESRGRYLLVSYARLAIFLGGIAGAYFLFQIDPLYGILCGTFAFLGFLYLVKIHSEIAAQREHIQQLKSICKKEQDAQSGDLSSFPDGSAYIDPQHAYSFDLDMFGKNSIFQLLNRTGTVLGTQRLVHVMEFPEQDVEEIRQRQEGIRELSQDLDWNLEFEAIALAQQESFDDTKTIKWWVEQPVYFSQRPVYKVLVWLLPALLILAFAAWILNYLSFMQPILGEARIPFFPVLILFFLQLTLAGFHMRRTSEQQTHVGQKSRMLRKYGALLKLIESRDFSSPYLKSWTQNLQANGKRASEALNELAEIGYMFDQRLNVLMGLLLNGVWMWDIRYMIRLEKWRAMYKPYLSSWFEQIAQWDSLNSLGRFAHNHPEYIYPEVLEGDFQMDAVALGHPLIDPAVRVDNDIRFRKPGEFIITTGANMAGKSTFLRTVGVNLLLSMMGVPVCAQSYRFAPIELMTSVRITDSIAENESFFYAELKRLKTIIDSLKSKGQPIFIIVDEMLRGTNSKDKTKGSRGFIEQLIKLRGVGMIATHDLSLGTLADEYPDFAFNKRFEVSITEDKLSFDYKFQDGISQNLNATFLMEQMGILERKQG